MLKRFLAYYKPHRLLFALDMMKNGIVMDDLQMAGTVSLCYTVKNTIMG